MDVNVSMERSTLIEIMTAIEKSLNADAVHDFLSVSEGCVLWALLDCYDRYLTSPDTVLTMIERCSGGDIDV